MDKIDFEWDDNKSKTNIKNQYAPQYNCGAVCPRRHTISKVKVLVRVNHKLCS